MIGSGQQGRRPAPPPAPQIVGIGTALRNAYAESPLQPGIFDTLLAKLANS